MQSFGKMQPESIIIFKINIILFINKLCEAYEVGWDFVIAPEQQQQQGSQGSQPHQNHAASHTGEGPSCQC